ncbi:hypothetical protein, partial [Leclercia adecarboxylata]|uniref:hypothetical protein n=1 Tax=Leclercia adecarboxylata TaxID=83655 RepID=UPI00234C67F8
PVAGLTKWAAHKRRETVVHVGLDRLYPLANFGTLTTPSIKIFLSVVLMRRVRQSPVPKEFDRVPAFVQVIAAALDRPPRLRLPAFQSRPHKRTFHQEWMFSHASLVPDSLRGVNTFFVLTCYIVCGTHGNTMKQETEGLHI